MNWLQAPLKRLLTTLLIGLLMGLLTTGTAGCSSATKPSGPLSRPARGTLSEVSPPYTIQVLKQALAANQPQVKILSPKPNQVVNDTEVAVKLQVKDLDLFRDEELELGPYLQVWLDSQPYTQLYGTSEPITLENLTPGTHTIRVLAVQPWHESFKNDGAFAQNTFHVFTQTAENNPDPTKPLLTYNYPQGVYGAEPVLLDFHLSNAPLHLVARESDKDEIPDWQLRCTINGESFTFDRWEPIYLKGLKRGKNWVQLELLDDKGELLPNAFNSAVQLVTYEPGGTDTLARLTRGELTADDARKIVDPNYVPPVEPPVVPVVPEVAKPEAEPEAEPETEAEQLKSSEPSESSNRTESDAAEPESLPTVEPTPKAKAPEPEPELILEPDLTEELTPETAPPELIAPQPPVKLPIAPIEDAVPEPVKPVQTPIVQPGEPEQPSQSAKPVPTSATDLIQQLQPPTAPEKVIPDEARLQPSAGEPRPDQVEEPRQPFFGRSGRSPAARPLKIAPPEPPEPPELPDLKAPPPVAAPVPPPLYPMESQTDLDQTAPAEPFKALEDRLNQVLQPDAPLESPANTLDSLGLPEFQPSLQPNLPPAERPDLFSALDRVKAFFEGLKRPARDKPLLKPLLQPDLTAPAPEEQTVIDTLIDALPDALRQSVLEDLAQPLVQPAPSDLP